MTCMTMTHINPSTRAWPRLPAPLVIAVVIAMVCTCVAVPAGAAQTPRASHPLMLAQAATAISADEAAALVRTASGGRILGVSRANGAGGPVYQVKVLLDKGRVRVYVVDANSGQILR
ncbi:MAG: hypothetical protein E4H01_08605 [Lysobacterales bacterium]|nr:MAG: hypothetical protein E4H01_08605 [Xanthomonadales bacterium]